MVSAPSAVPRKTPRADNAALPEVAEETAATSAASATTKSAAGGGGRKASTSKAGKAKAEAAATPVVGEGAGSKEAPSGSEPASNGSTKGKGKAKARPSTGSVEIAETPPPPPPQESGSPNKPRPPTAASIKQDKQLQADWERRFNELGATVAITDDSQLEDGAVFLTLQKRQNLFYLADAETRSWHANRYARLGALRSASLLSGRGGGSVCGRHAAMAQSGSATPRRSQQDRSHVL